MVKPELFLKGTKKQETVSVVSCLIFVERFKVGLYC
jgi:hypothetical protein